MVVMKPLFPSQKLFLVLGFACVLVLALACAKSAEKAAPAPAPATPAAPAAAPAPSAAPGAPAAPAPADPFAALQSRPDGQPLVLGGPPFFPKKLAQQKGIQLHFQYHQTKLPLWTKAKYGGQLNGIGSYTPGLTFEYLGRLSLSRVVTAGMLLTIDMGRCSLVGREGKFDTCQGQYAHNYDITIVPSIIERWEQPGPLTYVFHVRKGVLWPAVPPMTRTDRTVTAEDIAWYLDVTREKGILKDNFVLVDKFEAVDRNTVKVTMKSPHAEFLRHMANTSMGILPKECVEDKECLGNKNISPGPFLFVEQESVTREKITYQRNPEFYLKGLPYLDRLFGINFTDTAAIKAAFTTGKLDSLYLTTLPEVDHIKKQVPDAWAHSSWVLGGNTVMRPQLVGPLADVRVRRAMAMTMDMPFLWEATYLGHTTFPNLVSRDVFGAEWYYTLEQAGEYYQFNPTRAKQLMTEAGYANGFTVILTAGPYIGFGADNDQAIALQAQWKKYLNVEVKIKAVDNTAYNAAMYGSSWEGMLHQRGWNITYWADEEGPLIHMTKGQRLNLQKIDDPFINDLYLKQRGELDPVKRRQMLWQFEQYELSQVYFFRLAVLTSFAVGQGFELNGASHQVTWFGVFNGPTWLMMADTSKMPQR